MPHAKYKITKEVTNAQSSGKYNLTYTNIVLPKGSIVHNLAGGVFVESEKLKDKYSDIYNSKYGLRIIEKEETLNQIYNNSQILEYVKGGEVYNNSKYLTKEQWEKWNDYVKTGKINGKKVNNIFTVARHIGVPVAKINSYNIEQRAKGNFADGGKTTFKQKATAIAKNFEGKKVEPKYQKEYGKTYDKAEAKEVGNKIAGSMKAKYDSKMSGGGKTKRGGAMVLAKQIRKEGESWASALKRANEQMRNK